MSFNKTKTPENKTEQTSENFSGFPQFRNYKEGFSRFELRVLFIQLHENINILITLLWSYNSSGCSSGTPQRQTLLKGRKFFPSN